MRENVDHDLLVVCSHGQHFVEDWTSSTTGSGNKPPTETRVVGVPGDERVVEQDLLLAIRIEGATSPHLLAVGIEGEAVVVFLTCLQFGCRFRKP